LHAGRAALSRKGARRLYVCLMVTKNGKSYVALIDADRLDYYHRLERERIHLLLIDDAQHGLADIAAGRTQEADAAVGQLQQRRASATKKRG
jgi:hypothetical protein